MRATPPRIPKLWIGLGLLVLIFLLGIGTWFVHVKPYRRQIAFVQWHQKETAGAPDHSLEIEPGGTWWMRAALGREYCLKHLPSVRSVSLSTYSCDDLRRLSPLKNLQKLVEPLPISIGQCNHSRKLLKEKCQKKVLRNLRVLRRKTGENMEVQDLT